MPVQVKRGDVVLVPFPNSNLRSAKLRPALVIQSDHLDSELPQVILAMISSNLDRVGRKSRVGIDVATNVGRASGLLSDSVVMTDNIATVRTSELVRVIGRIPDMSKVDLALMHAVGLEEA